MIITNVAAALPGERDFRLVDIFIKEGKITAIKEAGTLKGAGGPNVDPARSADEEILDAKGLLAFPGAIDPHVHFDEPASPTAKTSCTAPPRRPVEASPR